MLRGFLRSLCAFVLASFSHASTFVEPFSQSFATSPNVLWSPGNWVFRSASFAFGGSSALTSPIPSITDIVTATATFDTGATIQFAYAIVNFNDQAASIAGRLDFSINGNVQFTTSSVTTGAISPVIAVPSGRTVLGWTYTRTGGNPAARQTSGAIDNVTLQGAWMQPCQADFNKNYDISTQDLFDFLMAWFSGDASADFNASGGVSVQDLFSFLAAWFARC